LKKALLLNAVSVIIAHNHPGGSVNPSRQDKELTQEFKSAFDAIGIKMLDHVIIPAYSTDYYSFAENDEI
jgi:DNA repair protein RadC